MRIFTAFVTLFLLSGSVLAEPFAEDFFSDGFAGFEQAKESAFDFSGYFEETLRHYADKGYALQNRQKLFLEQQVKAEYVRGYLSEILENDTEKRYGKKAESSVDEAYVTLDTRKFDIIAGKKMLRWGTGDGINPLDLVNPKDADNLFSNARSDSRKSVHLADFIYTGRRLTLELALIPKAAVMSMPKSGNPWLPESMKNLYQSDVRINGGNKPDGAETAARVYGTFGSTDLGLIFFDGYDDTPFLTADEGGLTAGYKPMRAFGLTFASGFEKSTLRGEFSVKPDKYVQHELRPEKHDYYEWVLGYDLNFRDTGYVNFQLFGTYLTGENLPTDRKTTGVSFEVSEKYFQDDLKAGVRSTAYFTDESGAGEVFVSWKYGDNLELTAGYTELFGKKDSAYGQFGSNDFFYSSIKYSF